MNENFCSQTKLTEFPPLAPEENEQGVGHLISKLLKFGRNAITGEQTTSATTILDHSVSNDNISEDSIIDVISDNSTIKTDSSSSNYHYRVDVTEGRNLPNVLKRVSNLLALKSSNLQAYGDTELKQYWMPDSVSRECYECCEKFTTFRRRHHCRICGQIFCSQCCNQKIPGKIVGCTGDLRACTYCCKVVLTYLQSPDVSAHLTADLRAFQEDLQTKFANDSESLTQNIVAVSNSDISDTGSLKRNVSVCYQEERFALGRASNPSYLSTEERIRALQNSISLRNLYEELCRPSSGMILQTHRYRLRSYSNTLLGSELVDWLISQKKANTRVQASAISQALLEACYLDCVTEQNGFCDGWALYRLQLPLCQEIVPAEQKFDARNQDEPSWMQQIPHESSTTDSEAELPSPCAERPQNRLPSSASSFFLDLNFEDNSVHLTRPTSTNVEFEEPQINSVIPSEVPIVKTSQHRELVPETGWHNAINLRDDNGERVAYELLTNAYRQHEIGLINQLLCSNGLSLNWRDVIVPIVREIVDKIRPDFTHDAEYLDIRNYVQFKKMCGGHSSECKVIEGITCSKNIAHRNMASRIDNPKILLLNCSLVYQRIEGRLMSLEPVILQEHEYLRNVAARIVALQPNLVLVHRNVSRLAQDLLREHEITLVLNVKLSILQRLARCTSADLVTSVDAQVGRSRLGTCRHFYLKTFSNKQSGMRKTLMFFDGLPSPHLGATILLRGASKSELTRLKQVVSIAIFASYNWRLEKSFLMDEFAQPPNSKSDELFAGDGSSKESSPGFNATQTKTFTQQPEKLNDKKLPVECIEDFSDPLHSVNDDDDVFRINNNEEGLLSVAELPFGNKFRKALDDTVLTVSPYLKFTIPYLETEIGRKCKLRKFFPENIYHSQQFLLKSEVTRNEKEINENSKNKTSSSDLIPPHPFISVKLITKISESNEVQSLLSNFRACGGRLPLQNELNCNPVEEDEQAQLRQECDYNYSKPVDILDLKNHQRLAVLFCSFSHKSNNAPAFCVDPWVVNMYFYGTDDIPLGCFLERFCFRLTYTCPSNTCDTPMLEHVRRFVHNSGCVSLSLNSFDSQFKEENIVMWSWCTKCSAVSPVVPMSSDTWSFSLAKYLEMRFHGYVYSRRGNEACCHSLHHDHYQYFGYKNIVASFKYTSVKQWEVSLPPPLIRIVCCNNQTNQHCDIIDEIKSLALRGHEIFSIVFEKLSILPTENDVLNVLKQQLQKEHSVFKGKVEQVQLKLTSPTLEDKKSSPFSQEDVQSLLWPLEDLMVQLKRIIADTVETWNTRLIGSHNKKDVDKRKEKQQTSQIIEDTDVSETESTVLSSPDTRYLDSNSENEQQKKIRNTIDSNVVTKKIKSLDHGDWSDDNVASCNSAKGHSRSQSDGTVMTQSEDVQDSKKESGDKKTVKTILAQLLQSTQGISHIQCPFSQQEHHLLPATFSVSLIVFENEPGSIIAYALDSFDYRKSIEELIPKKIVPIIDQSSSPVHKRKNLSSSDRSSGNDLNLSGEKYSGLLSFLWTTPGVTPVNSTGETSEGEDREKVDEAKKSKPPYIEVEFQDVHCNFCCRVYCAEKFVWLRNRVIPAGEEAFIRSLSRTVQWNARGGKSGSSFCKTKDDRFILKEMTKQELQQFLDSANNYFTYMEQCISSRLPTLLGKIVGVYQILFRNVTTNANLRMNLLVMENLFYNRIVTHKFDLKGSMRNRLVNPDDQDGEIVLLDENLLKRTCESPLYIYPHSKAVLTAAIQSDTKFLSSQKVMDYSLLVGLDQDAQELVVGIIDYIRIFTWDKKLEHMVKKAGMLGGGQGKTPTIISPDDYRNRFIAAMHRYFLQVPDRWTGLGLEL